MQTRHDPRDWQQPVPRAILCDSATSARGVRRIEHRCSSMTVQRVNNRTAAMQAIEAKVARVMRIRAESMRAEIYGVLEESRVGSGREYKTPRGTHRASAPGQSPARLSGRLQESVKSKRVTDRLWTVGPDPSAFPDEFYPSLLEFGTDRIAPRPFMRPAIERFKRQWSGVRGQI